MINHGHTEIAFVADYEGNIVLTKRFNGYKKLWRTVIFLSVLNIFSAIHLHMRAVSKPAVPLQAASHQSQQW